MADGLLQGLRCLTSQPLLQVVAGRRELLEARLVAASVGVERRGIASEGGVDHRRPPHRGHVVEDDHV